MTALPDNFEIPKWLYRRWIWHVAFWTTYFMVVSIEDVLNNLPAQSDYWKLYVADHLPMMATIYATTLFGVPKLLYRKKMLLFAIFVLVAAFLAGLLTAFLWNFFLPRVVFQGVVLSAPNRLGNISLKFFFIFLSTALKIVKDVLIAVQRRADQSAQNLQGELLALRNQISPHFLLNSLNTIYGLAITEPQSVGPVVLTLSDLLRFSLYETRTDRVSLEREIQFLADYVALQRLRASEKLTVKFTTPAQLHPAGLEIAPLMLLVFIENAFKYAQTNPQNERYLHISIDLEKKPYTNFSDIEGNFKEAYANRDYPLLLRFQCTNTFTEHTAHPVGGLGLENVKRRLELIYPKKHRLQMQAQSGVWQVDLEIDLTTT